MRYVWIMAILSALSLPAAQAEDRYGNAGAAPAGSGPVMRGKDGEIIDSTGGGAIAARPLQPYIADGIQYLSGGIGDEEQEQLKSVASEYNVQVMFSMKSGAYVSNIPVRVFDSGNKEVLAVADAGPFLYIRLPAGRYALEAMRAGETRKTNFTASDKKTAKPHLAFSQ